MMSSQTTEDTAPGSSQSTADQSQKSPEPLREVELLTDVLSHIPTKVQRGLNTHYENLELTALDANHYFIALGTNVGTVFLYDRAKCTIQRLKSEDSTDCVACVCLHHGLDDLVAVGHVSGTVYIFQLPSMMIGHSKQLERFIVSDIHKSSLTCLKWSTNGMRLFSGDLQGYVGCAEVDFYLKECKSSVILIESNSPIVQLDHGHKALLVSTKHRSILYRTEQHETITQVGTKDRKVFRKLRLTLDRIPIWHGLMIYTGKHLTELLDASCLGDFGACFIPAMCKPVDAMLYASRPGYRIWKASVNSSVQHTYMFKELLSQPHYEFPLLPYHVSSINKSQNAQQFGPLLLYQGKYIVTWNELCFYVLNPENSSIIGSQNHCGFIKSVAVTDTEIFILRQGTDRNLIRISDQPMTRPTHQLLKQLEAERHCKDTPSASVTMNSQKVTTEPENSPNKASKPTGFHPGNLFEKVISKPSTLVDKLQEKLSLDKKSAKPDGEDNSGKDKKEKKPSPDWLPPIVQLDSPSLINIELGIKLETGTPSEHKDAMSDSKEVTTLNQSPVKTGTGAISALARLQEDHRIEENSEPIFRSISQLEDSMTVENAIEPVDDNELVVHKKVKTKKKKKKEKKEKKITDSDAVSVNSSTSVTSDNSEVSTRTDFSDVKPIIISPLPDKLLECKVEVDSGLENSSNDSVLDGSANDTLDQPITKSVQENEKPEKIQNDAIIESIVVDDDSNEVLSRTTVDSNTKNNSTISGDKPLSDHRNTDENKDEKKDLTVVGEETKKTSKSPRDLSWLDAYLENDGDEPDANELKSDANQRLYMSVCKDSRSREEKEMDVLNSLLESDTKYIPSRLENQLSQLEKTTVDEDNETYESVEGHEYKQQISTTSLSDYKPSIYSIYKSSGSNVLDLYSEFDATSPTESLSENSDKEKMAASVWTYKAEDDASFHELPKTPQLLKCFNTWTEISAQGNIHSISVSCSHVWITDKSYNIFYSALSSPGVSWKKAIGSATQISVSPDGNIVWALHKNAVMAGTKITPKRAEGLKWVEAVRDVAYICVDNSSAWYIKTNQQIMMQSKLSRDRPCFTGVEVDCSHRLKQIVCRAGVVWALTENCSWLYREGITEDCPRGTSWENGDRSSENRLFSNLALGEDGYGWAVDIVGQVWFCCGVTKDKPRGEKCWWQVPVSGEYMLKDLTAFDMLKSFSKKFDPQKLTVLLSSQSGGLVAASNGVWFCPEYKNVVHVCRGSIEGHLWSEAHPETLAHSSCWKTVVASTADKSNGLVWAQQPNGDIFAFSSNRQNCTSIPGPTTALSYGVLFACMSVCRDALWGLTHNGQVFIRTGMSDLEPRGSGWSDLDLSQLEDTQLVSVSCANLNVWSVDSDGGVWHRIGVKAPTDLSLNAAWLPVENGGTVFTQVVSGPQDWKVWAIDNRRQVFVRSGITQSMPIGRKWIHISDLSAPGGYAICTPAMHITLSEDYVFALNHGGELLCRYGVTSDNVTGDYWRKLPGELTYISAMPDNTLWGINKEGQLVKRYTQHIIRRDFDLPELSRRVVRRPTGSSVGSEEGDWEFV